MPLNMLERLNRRDNEKSQSILLAMRPISESCLRGQKTALATDSVLTSVSGTEVMRHQAGSEQTSYRKTCLESNESTDQQLAT